jgi:predicted metal-dependent hydrolase
VHEVLEAQWKQEAGDPKVFLQGLIQVAVAFYHLQNQNYRGALTLLKEGREKLLPYRPRFLGMELETLTAKLEACYQELRQLGPERMNDFTWQHIPKMHWNEAG